MSGRDKNQHTMQSSCQSTNPSVDKFWPSSEDASWSYPLTVPGPYDPYTAPPPLPYMPMMVSSGPYVHCGVYPHASHASYDASHQYVEESSCPSASFYPPPGLHLNDEVKEEYPKSGHVKKEDPKAGLDLKVEVKEDPKLGQPDDMLCCICQERQKDHVIVPCGHQCVCAGCKGNLPEKSPCPICREPIQLIMPVFT